MTTWKTAAAVVVAVGVGLVLGCDSNGTHYGRASNDYSFAKASRMCSAMDSYPSKLKVCLGDDGVYPHTKRRCQKHDECMALSGWVRKAR